MTSNLKFLRRFIQYKLSGVPVKGHKLVLAVVEYGCGSETYDFMYRSFIVDEYNTILYFVPFCRIGFYFLRLTKFLNRAYILSYDYGYRERDKLCEEIQKGNTVDLSRLRKYSGPIVDPLICSIVVIAGMFPALALLSPK